jgi:hypothetical protein
VGARRHYLHRRDLQKPPQADLCQRCRITGPAHLFNATLDSHTRRAIDFREGDNIDEDPLKKL